MDVQLILKDMLFASLGFMVCLIRVSI